jgi:Tfp pilus assembly protein PilO
MRLLTLQATPEIGVWKEIAEYGIAILVLVGALYFAWRLLQSERDRVDALRKEIKELNETFRAERKEDLKIFYELNVLLTKLTSQDVGQSVKRELDAFFTRIKDHLDHLAK